MFDELEEWFDKNRKSRKPIRKDNEPEEGLFDSFTKKPAHSHDEDEDQMKEIVDILKQKFGGKVEVLGGGTIAIEKTGSSDAHKGIFLALTDLKIKVDRSIKVMTMLLKAQGIPPACSDAKGKPIKDGDIVEFPDGMNKKVLEVGYGYAFLSHTDDHTKDDGVWFEEEFKDTELRLKK